MEKLSSTIRNSRPVAIVAAVLMFVGIFAVLPNLFYTLSSFANFMSEVYYYGVVYFISPFFSIISYICFIAGFLIGGLATILKKNKLFGIGMLLLSVTYILYTLLDTTYYVGSGGYIMLPALIILANLILLALCALYTIAIVAGNSSISNLLNKIGIIALAAPVLSFILTLVFYSANGFSTSLTIITEYVGFIGLVLAAIIYLEPAVESYAYSNANAASEPKAPKAKAKPDTEAVSGTDYRSIAVVILLSIVTCGIYMIYWVYKTSEFVNSRLATGKSSTVQVICYLFVPFYALYWIYKTTENLCNYALSRRVNNDSSMAVMNLVLAIFGFAIISVALMQDLINKIVLTENPAALPEKATPAQPAQPAPVQPAPVQPLPTPVPEVESYDYDATIEETVVEPVQPVVEPVQPVVEPVQPVLEPIVETVEETVDNTVNDSVEPAPAVNSKPNDIDALLKLKSLMDSGAISEEEFQMMKSRIIK